MNCCDCVPEHRKGEARNRGKVLSFPNLIEGLCILLTNADITYVKTESLAIREITKSSL